VSAGDTLGCGVGVGGIYSTHSPSCMLTSFSPKIFLNVNANPFNLPTVNEPFKWTQNPLPKLTYSMEEDLDQLLMASYMNKPADKDDSLEEFKPLHKQKSLANIPVQMMMSESESSDSNEAITLAVTKMANSLKEIE
jgi:hypothetical protein